MAERGAGRQILDQLRAAIESGQLVEGARLPSNAELQQAHGISLTTANRILRALQHEGLAVGRTGAGVFVRTFQLIVRDASARLSATQWGQGRSIQDADTGLRPRSVGLKIRREQPPAFVATLFGLADGQELACRSRRFEVDDRAVQLSTSYLPVDLAERAGVLETETGPGGMYARLAEIGRAPVRFSEQVRARMPQQHEVAALTLSPGTSVVAIVRCAFDKDGELLEVNEILLDGAVYELRYDISA